MNKEISKAGVHTQFSAINQPVTRGRPKGSKNKATLIRKWLDVEVDLTDDDGNVVGRITQGDKLVLAMIRKADKEDVAAFTVLMDGAYGKSPIVIEKEDDPHAIDWSQYTSEELIQIETAKQLIKRGRKDGYEDAQEVE